MQGPECCPTCRRPFKSVIDYPRVRVLSFKRLPLPEAIDTMSAAAAQVRLSRRRENPNADFDLSAGINMTPKLADACDMAEVRSYLEHLAGQVDHEIAPQELLPPLKAHGLFRWAYPIGKTGIYLSLGEAETELAGARAAEVQLHCAGPNLGSAGGP